MLPSVCIIICNYNYERYVGEAIASALNQTHPAKEIIVVDDGSTDGSRAEIEKYAGIKTIFKANGGQTSGVRAALEQVSAEVLVILDSDDLLLPCAVKEIARNWNSALTLLQFRLEKRDASGKIIGYYPDPERPFLKGGERDFVLKYGYIPASPTTGNAFAVSHVKHAFKSNLARDRAATDGYLIFTAPLYGEILSLDEVLGVYRLHGANVTDPSKARTLRYLKNHVGTAHSHSEGLAHHAKALGLSRKPAKAYLSPYEWRAALELKRMSPYEAEVTRLSVLEITLRGIWGFMHRPQLTIGRRLRNIVGMAVLALSPSVHIITRRIGN